MSRVKRRPPHRRPRAVRAVTPPRQVHGRPPGVPAQLLDWPCEDPEDRQLRIAHGFAYSAPDGAVCAYGCGETYGWLSAHKVLVCASGNPPAPVSPDCQIGECSNCAGCDHDCGTVRQ